MDDAPRTEECEDDPRSEKERLLSEHVLAVRLGHGANCSSIGSVIDTLFGSAVVAGALFAAVCAALASEKVTVVGSAPAPADPATRPESDDPNRP